MFNVVLVEPEIPNNTGNIGRICVASNSKLHLIKPLGFEISDARVKRAGLDYWPDLELAFHDSLSLYMSQVKTPSRVFMFSSHGQKSLYDVQLKEGDSLVFGKESSGLGQNLLSAYSDHVVTIPFTGKVRSFNLANSVAMAIGEGMRQLNKQGN